jgi:hypothetical protein
MPPSVSSPDERIRALQKFHMTKPSQEIVVAILLDRWLTSAELTFGESNQLAMEEKMN